MEEHPVVAKAIIEKAINAANAREAAQKARELARRKGVYSELLRYQIKGNKKLLSEYELH